MSLAMFFLPWFAPFLLLLFFCVPIHLFVRAIHTHVWVHMYYKINPSVNKIQKSKNSFEYYEWGIIVFGAFFERIKSKTQKLKRKKVESRLVVYEEMYTLYAPMPNGNNQIDHTESD